MECQGRVNGAAGLRRVVVVVSTGVWHRYCWLIASHFTIISIQSENKWGAIATTAVAAADLIK